MGLVPFRQSRLERNQPRLTRWDLVLKTGFDEHARHNRTHNRNPRFSSSTIGGPPSDCGPDKDDHRKHARFYWQMDAGSSSFDRASTPLSRQHTLSRTLAQDFTGGGGILFNFAHLYGNIFAPPRSHDPTMESDEAPEDTAARAISLRVSLRQTRHVQGERSVLRKNGIDAFSTKDA